MVIFFRICIKTMRIRILLFEDLLRLFFIIRVSKYFLSSKVIYILTKEMLFIIFRLKNSIPKFKKKSIEKRSEAFI